MDIMAATATLPGLTDLLATLGGRRVLSGRVHDSEDLLVRVRAGLPYAALESLQAGYGFDGDLLREVLDVPARTLARRKSSRRFSPRSRIGSSAWPVSSPSRPRPWVARTRRASGSKPRTGPWGAMSRCGASTPTWAPARWKAFWAASPTACSAS